MKTLLILTLASVALAQQYATVGQRYAQPYVVPAVQYASVPAAQYAPARAPASAAQYAPAPAAQYAPAPANVADLSNLADIDLTSFSNGYTGFGFGSGKRPDGKGFGFGYGYGPGGVIHTAADEDGSGYGAYDAIPLNLPAGADGNPGLAFNAGNIDPEALKNLPNLIISLIQGLTNQQREKRDASSYNYLPRYYAPVIVRPVYGLGYGQPYLG